MLLLQNHFDVITILIIGRQDYRKEKETMALEIVIDGKNDKSKNNV